VRRWRVFEEVVRNSRSDLPDHLQSLLSVANLSSVSKALQKMGIAIAFREENLTRQKAGERERSAIAETYILWRLKMAPYRGKWNDMHLLARRWHMSPTDSGKNFQSVVNRICNGTTSTNWLGRSWESALPRTYNIAAPHPPTRP
jgi:hypothetical protein